MSKSQRDKGARVEREIVNMHREAGISAERVPLSGAAGGSFTGDIVIGGNLRAEVKARKDGAGFVTLEGWLGDNDILFLKRNRRDPMVVMDWQTYVSLMLHELRRQAVKAV